MDDAVDEERGAEIEQGIAPDVRSAWAETEWEAEAPREEGVEGDLMVDGETRGQEECEARRECSARTAEWTEREIGAEGECVDVARSQNIDGDFCAFECGRAGRLEKAINGGAHEGAESHDAEECRAAESRGAEENEERPDDVESFLDARRPEM